MTLVSTPSVDTDSDDVNDTYKQGDVVRARVTFDSAVDVLNKPTLKLRLDRGLEYMDFDSSGGSANVTTLDFTYTVVAGDLIAQGIAFEANSLLLRKPYLPQWWQNRDQNMFYKGGWALPPQSYRAIIHATGYGGLDGVDADLSFSQVDADPAHKVDGSLSAE